MANTNWEQLQERLKCGFDREYHDRLYKLLCWGFGEKEAAQVTADSDFPDYRDVTPTNIEVGRSRKILNSQFIGLTKAMYGEPEPEIKGVDQFSGEVLKQFYLNRSRGGGDILCSDSEWMTERQLAFMEGDGVGVGWLQVGLRTNPQTDAQRVVVRHVQTTNVIWDPYRASPTMARWICFVHNMDPDEARHFYGEDAVRRGTRSVMDGGKDTRRKVVRIFEYYDRGIGDKDPTMCLIPGSFAEEPIAGTLTANPYNDCLPAAHYEHFVPPGCKRPIGRILLQLAAQEEMNQIEERMRENVRSGDAADLVDLSVVDPEDVKKIKQGLLPRFIKFAKFWDGKPPFVRLPARETARSTMERYSMLDRQFTEDSGNSESDRGLLSPEKRTLGEHQILEDKVASKASWSRLQAARMERRLVEKTLYIAGLYDRDPVTVDIFGANVVINDPMDPRSTIDQFVEGASQVLIDEASLEYQDQQRKQAMRLGNLNQLTDLVGMGIIDPQQLAIEKLKAIGEKDPDSWLLQMQSTPGVPPSPGLAAVPA